MRSQRGSVVPAVVAMVGVLALLGAACAVVGALVLDHRRAQSAADLAALAAARAQQVGADPCGQAREVAEANAARLLRCDLEPAAVRVTVRVVGPHWLGQLADLDAVACAGSAASG